MKSVTAAIVMSVLMMLVGGTAFSSDATGPATGDCLSGGIAVCMLSAPTGEQTAARVAQRASGVVIRTAATEGRYVVRHLNGLFRLKSPVSIYSPQGEFVASGTVRDVFDEELYVDLAPGATAPVGVGFPVLMNYTTEEAARFIASARELFAGEATQAREEARQVRQEIAADARQAAADRQKWQEDMEKLKYQIGFYDFPYYYYYPPYWW